MHIVFNNLSLSFSKYSTFGKWYVCGDVVGKKNGKEVQEVQEIVYAFSFIRIIYKPKDYCIPYY
jgi:hypothetical protein